MHESCTADQSCCNISIFPRNSHHLMMDLMINFAYESSDEFHACTIENRTVVSSGYFSNASSHGQHSLTSVERPSHLRSDFVNVSCYACLVVPPVTHVSFASTFHSDLSDDLMFVSMSCLAFSIIPRLIQPRRCRCICLERMF